MPKITKKPKAPEVIKVKTTTGDVKDKMQGGFKWWKANSKAEMANQVLSNAAFLKEQQLYRFRQAAIYARLYSNVSIFNFAGTTLTKITTNSNNALPMDRPTMNVVQSCIDTVVARIAQSKPRPVFLTDNGDYKKRTLAKQLNQFIMGEFYENDAYAVGAQVFRDAKVMGTGCIKICEDIDHKVSLERRLAIELLVDPSDALYGKPYQLYEYRLVSREALIEYFPEYRAEIKRAEQAFTDNSQDYAKSISDQVMVVEAWKLPTGKDTKDGKHAIVCSAGVILEEDYDKPHFPFVFLHDSPRMLGMWGQGIPERLMGTQVEINKLLQTISMSTSIMGVPRVWIEDGSKVVKAHINNQVGMIGTYRGTKPIFEVAAPVNEQLYMQLKDYIQFAYQQEGVSTMAAASQKPIGLNSGAALREADDIQSDRLAMNSHAYTKFYEELAYQIIDKAVDIAKEQGKYETVYPDKHGSFHIDLPDVKELDDPYVVQCFDSSSLPRDPAGRLQKVTEMMQAGIVTLQEGRRLLDYPDIEQVDKLANAEEERVYQMLDKIIEQGEYTPPDVFITDIPNAIKITAQYYNLYEQAKLEEERAQMLRDFFAGLMEIQKQAQPPAAPALPTNPQAVPEARPESSLLPNVPQA